MPAGSNVSPTGPHQGYEVDCAVPFCVCGCPGAIDLIQQLGISLAFYFGEYVASGTADYIRATHEMPVGSIGKLTDMLWATQQCDRCQQALSSSKYFMGLRDIPRHDKPMMRL